MRLLVPALLLLLGAAPASAQDAGAPAPGPLPAAGNDAGTAAPPAPAAGTVPAATLPSARPATAPDGRSAAASVSLDRVPLGGTFRYTLTVRHPAGDRVQLMPRSTNPFAPFQARALPTQSRGTDGALQADTFVFELVALAPGATEVPAVPVSLLTADGRAFELAAPAVKVAVADPTANEPIADLQPKGAKGADARTNPVRPYVVQVRDWTLAWVLGIVGGALLLALITVLVTRWVMKRRRSALEAAAPPPPPYPIARRRLAELRVEGVYGRMGAKGFHVELTDAVKEYLGRRHAFDALEMTSEELLEAIAGVPMGNVGRMEMELFLSACDFVKFAKAEPAEREALDALGQGERIVDEVERAAAMLEMRRAAEAAARAAAEAAQRGPDSPGPAPGPSVAPAAPAPFAPPAAGPSVPAPPPAPEVGPAGPEGAPPPAGGDGR